MPPTPQEVITPGETISHVRTRIPRGLVARPPEHWLHRIQRLVRSGLVGIAATGSDFLLLESLVRLLRFSPTAAKFPALLLGSLIQFVGVRHFAFRAREGHLGRQLKLFIVAEVLGVVLTLGVFHLLVRALPVPMELANFLSGSIVYFGFSYPLFHLIFRVRPEDQARKLAQATARVVEATPAQRGQRPWLMVVKQAA